MGEHEEAELRRDVAASVGARRALGRAYEDDLVRSFVERLDSTIREQVDAQVARRSTGDAGIVVAWAGIAGVDAAYAWGRPGRR